MKLTKRGLMIALSNPRCGTETAQKILMNSNEEALNYIHERPWYRYWCAVADMVGLERV